MSGSLRRITATYQGWLGALTAPRTLQMLAHVGLARYGIRPRRQSAVAAEPSIPQRNTLPRIIFQTWKTHELPHNYARWSSSFTRLNPHHEHVIWDDHDNREFIRNGFPWFLDYYDRYPKEIFRADMVRYFFLYERGGLYADMDTECLRPLDQFAYSGDVVLGRMGQNPALPHSIPNAMMASSPGQIFWLLVIAMAMELQQNHSSTEEMLHLGPEVMTGPILLKAAYDCYVSSSPDVVAAKTTRVLDMVRNGAAAQAGTIELLPAEAWYPVDWSNAWHQIFRKWMLKERAILAPAEAQRLFPRSRLVTYWTHSW
jgi:inositol phosphorylceramide mannosyltransferase catalytic subunit